MHPKAGDKSHQLEIEKFLKSNTGWARAAAGTEDSRDTLSEAEAELVASKLSKWQHFLRLKRHGDFGEKVSTRGSVTRRQKKEQNYSRQSKQKKINEENTKYLSDLFPSFYQNLMKGFNFLFSREWNKANVIVWQGGRECATE